MLLIYPTEDYLRPALSAWEWIGLDNLKPIAVTAFGDVFFQSEEDVLFLDTLEGNLTVAAHDTDELEEILNTEEGQDHYLFAGFVSHAMDEGKTLSENQCYDFKVYPVLGGEIEYENIEIADLAVSLDMRGQVHEQVKDLPPGTKVSDIKINRPQ